MSRPRSSDPLVNTGLRLPASLLARLDDAAAAASRSRADLIRSYLEVPFLPTIEPSSSFRPSPSPKSEHPKVVPLPLNRELMRNLAQVGNNLNQVVRELNSTGWEDIDYELLIRVVLEVQDAMHQLREDHKAAARLAVDAWVLEMMNAHQVSET